LQIVAKVEPEEPKAKLLFDENEFEDYFHQPSMVRIL